MKYDTPLAFVNDLIFSSVVGWSLFSDTATVTSTGFPSSSVIIFPFSSLAGAVSYVGSSNSAASSSIIFVF